MSWSGPLVAKSSDRPRRSTALQLPAPDVVDGDLTLFRTCSGDVMVGAGGVDAPGLSTSDPVVLREHAAAVLAAADLIEKR